MFSPNAAVNRTLRATVTLTLLLFLIPATAGAEPESTPLMISEVLPNAGQGSNDHRHEWVEIQNISNEPINLQGWSIEDDTISVPLPTITLEPGSFSLLVGHTSAHVAPLGATLVILETPRIGSGLRNDGDLVALVDPKGITRDMISWGDRYRPYHFDAPEPNESIIRDHRGLQGRASPPTPYAADPRGQMRPRPLSPVQNPPNSVVRIKAALVAPIDVGEAGEWITLQNVSDERLVMVNWTLSTAASRITLPSHLLKPGETLMITSAVNRNRPPPNSMQYVDDVIALPDSDGAIGGGLSRAGGHLIVRDPNLRWLATASWGSDDRFHQLTAPQNGEILHFRETDRVRPPEPSDWQSATPLRITSVALSRTGLQITLTSDARDQLDLSNWLLWIGEEAIPVTGSEQSPRHAIHLNPKAGTWAPLRLLRPDGSVAQTIPLPPSAGAAADAVEINRPLQTEPRRHQESSEPEVWISEVYPAAGMGRNDAAFEWFELTNRGQEPVNLDGWTITDNHGSDALDGIVIPPEGTIVIAAQNAQVPEADAMIADGRIGNGLANGGDRLVLKNALGEIVDSVSWGSDQTHATIEAPTPQASINRASPNGNPLLAPPSPGTVIEHQTDRQEMIQPETPSKEPAIPEQPDNADRTLSMETEEPIMPSRSPATVRITEIMPSPNVGDPEWIEIENFGDIPIALNRWTIADEHSSTEIHGELGPGERMIISAGAMPDLTDGSATLSLRRIGNSLNDEGDTVILRDSHGVVIDSVIYGSDEIPAPARGLSIALQLPIWVVNAKPTPGDAAVEPWLADTLAPAPTQDSHAQEGVPVFKAADVPADALNPWMIVSAGLSGVILVLLLLRWRPAEPSASNTLEAETTAFSSPQLEQDGARPVDEDESSQ